jgi:hypothetical protein
VIPELGVLAGRPVLTVAGRTYGWEDVLAAAELRGELGELERRTREGLACVRRAEAETSTPSAEEVRAAATVFRYDRNLLAAEELEAWLEAQGLTIGDWNRHLRRALLRERWADELGQVAGGFAVGDDEVQAVLLTEAVCTGFLRSAAERLAEDAALAAAGGAAPDGLAALTRAADAARARAPAPTEVEREIAAHALDWTRVEADALELDDAEAAREAALCVRVDGRSLAEVADDCGVPATMLALYLDDADPELRLALVSASPGELIGPLERDAGLTLLQVRGKAEPRADDPELGLKAAAALFARAVEREVRDRVVWHERP